MNIVANWLGRSNPEHVMVSEPAVNWRNDLDSNAWDRELAALGGHPLQSALWGDARREVDGISDHRLMALQDGKPIWMIRVEERRIPLLGWIGWAPRGPTGPPTLDGQLVMGAGKLLGSQGMQLLVTDPWRAAPAIPDDRRAARPQTIWIDLSLGTDAVWNGFPSSFRNKVRRAEKAGVICHATNDPSMIQQFISLCEKVSQAKGFDLRVTESLVGLLVASGSFTGGSVEAALIVASSGGQLSSGLFVIRIGKSMHQMWSATSREFRQERAGEAVQWAAMQWALDRGCQIYDLEGIDPVNNRSVYEFKAQLGGKEIELVGKQYSATSLAGHALAWFSRRRA